MADTPAVRFKGFTDVWEQRKLSEFGKATGGTSIESQFSEDGIYKVINIGCFGICSVDQAGFRTRRDPACLCP